jgi:hypothetical protein
MAARGNMVPPVGLKKKGLVLFLLKGNKFKDKKKNNLSIFMKYLIF